MIGRDLQCDEVKITPGNLSPSRENNCNRMGGREGFEMARDEKADREVTGKDA